MEVGKIYSTRICLHACETLSSRSYLPAQNPILCPCQYSHAERLVRIASHVAPPDIQM
jgi:hypothetical protein